MNNEKVQAAMDDLKVKQDLSLISKLEEEYNELSDKCNKLYTFIYSLDFKEKVPDSNEQCLLQEQHKRMEAYRTNLYQRIEHYRIKVKIALRCDYFVSWGDVVEKIHQKHHCGQDADCDDACCQARSAGSPCGSSVAAEKQAGYSTKLIGMQVIAIGDMPCDGCPTEHYGAPCVKLELVGGAYLCLAPQPNSIITE